MKIHHWKPLQQCDVDSDVVAVGVQWLQLFLSWRRKQHGKWSQGGINNWTEMQHCPATQPHSTPNLTMQRPMSWYINENAVYRVHLILDIVVGAEIVVVVVVVGEEGVVVRENTVWKRMMGQRFWKGGCEKWGYGSS